MYNRYIRNDNGVYTRVSAEERGASPSPPPPPPPPPPAGPRFTDRILERLHLHDVDTADILLLLILFFLFEEKADDELLIALGLLLIL